MVAREDRPKRAPKPVAWENELLWGRDMAEFRMPWSSSNHVSPHQYVTTDRHLSDTFRLRDFWRFVFLIRCHPAAFDRRFGRMRDPLRYLTIEGYDYWTMGWPISDTTVINRSRPEWAWRDDVFPGIKGGRDWKAGQRRLEV